ncbi:MAG: hypothetical protein JXR83_20185 [Deltaproteobacteria bacterium]|nr:hypothetical protein [Deltaproteobacteria bacterium]
MSDAQVEDEGTLEVVGAKGNVYQDNPVAMRHPPIETRLEMEKEKGERVEAAGAAIEQAARASKNLDAGAPAAIDKGKVEGSDNALKYHLWQDEQKRD